MAALSHLSLGNLTLPSRLDNGQATDSLLSLDLTTVSSVFSLCECFVCLFVFVVVVLFSVKVGKVLPRVQERQLPSYPRSLTRFYTVWYPRSLQYSGLVHIETRTILLYKFAASRFHSFELRWSFLLKLLILLQMWMNVTPTTAAVSTSAVTPLAPLCVNVGKAFSLLPTANPVQVSSRCRPDKPPPPPPQVYNQHYWFKRGPCLVKLILSKGVGGHLY